MSILIVKIMNCICNHPSKHLLKLDATLNITEESVTRYLEIVIKQQLPENVQGITLKSKTRESRWFFLSLYPRFKET